MRRNHAGGRSGIQQPCRGGSNTIILYGNIVNHRIIPQGGQWSDIIRIGEIEVISHPKRYPNVGFGNGRIAHIMHAGGTKIKLLIINNTGSNHHDFSRHQGDAENVHLSQKRICSGKGKHGPNETKCLGKITFQRFIPYIVRCQAYIKRFGYTENILAGDAHIRKLRTWFRYNPQTLPRFQRQDIS